jgi:hypothetical protein
VELNLDGSFYKGQWVNNLSNGHGFSRISMDSPIMGIGKMVSSLGSALSALLMAADMSDSSGTMQKMEKGTSIGLTNRILKGNLMMVRYFF